MSFSKFFNIRLLLKPGHGLWILTLDPDPEKPER